MICKWYPRFPNGPQMVPHPRPKFVFLIGEWEYIKTVLQKNIRLETLHACRKNCVPRCTQVQPGVLKCTQMFPKVPRCTQAYTGVRRCTQVCRGELRRTQVMLPTAFERIPCEHACHFLVADAAVTNLTCFCCYLPCSLSSVFAFSLSLSLSTTSPLIIPCPPLIFPNAEFWT